MAMLPRGEGFARAGREAAHRLAMTLAPATLHMSRNNSPSRTVFAETGPKRDEI